MHHHMPAEDVIEGSNDRCDDFSVTGEVKALAQQPEVHYVGLCYSPCAVV